MQKTFKVNQIVISILLFYAVIFSQIPRLIAYQGIVTDTSGNPRQDGKHSFSFEIFSDSSGGKALWTQNEELFVSKGIFGTLLGSKTPFNLPFNQQYWLSVSVNEKILSPRTQLSSVAYCFRADTANVAITSINSNNAKSALKADTATFAKTTMIAQSFKSDINGEMDSISVRTITLKGQINGTNFGSPRTLWDMVDSIVWNYDSLSVKGLPYGYYLITIMVTDHPNAGEGWANLYIAYGVHGKYFENGGPKNYDVISELSMQIDAHPNFHIVKSGNTIRKTGNDFAKIRVTVMKIADIN